MSKLQRAIDWMYSGHDRTQYAASKAFGIQQSCISMALKKHRADEATYNTVGADKLNEIDAWASANIHASHDVIAEHFGMTTHMLRSAYRGRELVARKLRLAPPPEQDPVAAMREQCAKVAEMIGGAAGGPIAQAIREIGV